MFSNDKNIKKSTGIYRCIDDINNLNIRIQIKEVLNDSLLATKDSKELETKNFQWQEKIFGKWQRNFYKDKNNCISDLEQNYHKEVIKTLENDDILYSYINEDEFCLYEETVCNSRNVTFTSNLKTLEMDENENGFELIDHFQEALKTPFKTNNYEYMYIMADFGEYIDDTWIKSEYILCTLKYDNKRKTLLVYPDFTKFTAYKFTIDNDMTKTYEYAMENTSKFPNSDLLEKQRKILNKIGDHEKKLKEQIIGTSFTTPQRNQLCVHLFCEILTAKNFEYNDIYVQYFIDLPEFWSSSDAEMLKGTTQACHTNDENLAHFGFPFDVALYYDIEKIEETGFFQSPYIYFEVISKDTWQRFRTEGLSYLNLPLTQPGIHSYDMECLRILPRSLSGNLRRFFIGDYRNYDDITWIGRPKDNLENNEKTLNKFGVNTLGTGQLKFRMNIIHHSQAFLEDVDGKFGRNQREKIILDKLTSSSLIKSVEQVLDAFQRARRNMIEARRKI